MQGAFSMAHRCSRTELLALGVRLLLYQRSGLRRPGPCLWPPRPGRLRHWAGRPGKARKMQEQQKGKQEYVDSEYEVAANRDVKGGWCPREDMEADRDITEGDGVPFIVEG